ncbi:hypothetical protein C8J57DRAFT_1533517 [Mycena rebaudengoi]|nr:hypothetical protein C8J57DRAFT_1533517 [Mycena rebaudengoi]
MGIPSFVPVIRIKIGDEHYSHRKGKIFTREHELLGCLEPGNVIAVHAGAQFLGWENHAKEGQLLVRITNGGPRKCLEQVDITKHVELDIKLQNEINAIYEVFVRTGEDLLVRS